MDGFISTGHFCQFYFLFSATEHNGKAHFHCRLVGPNFGLHEDPPIAAAMPAFSAYIAQYKSVPTQFTAERGAFREEEVS